ncbi:MAG: hypothetical protein WBB91_04325, partial [Nostocoides sp.]|uniref:hypothetical protein n=1 Tax=Nostocoides sp. TaxID=1917966 RepID=UPI003C73CCC3
PSCPRVGGVFRLRPVAEPRWWPDSPAQRAAAAELDARLAAEQARAALIANVAARQAALVHTRPTRRMVGVTMMVLVTLVIVIVMLLAD